MNMKMWCLGVGLALSSALAVPSSSATSTVAGIESSTAIESGSASAVFCPRHESGELTLRLALFDAAGLNARVTTSLKQEIERIFAGVGVGIEWMEPEVLAAGRPHGYVLKVLMLGFEPTAWNLRPDVMGTVLGRRFPATAVYLFEPVIVRTLVPSGRRLMTPLELGRAFGRVTAHEIVHVLAPDLEHASSGLMAAAQHGQSLNSPVERFDGQSATAFRLGLSSVLRRERR